MDENTKFEKPIKDVDIAAYCEWARWCNENDYLIKDDDPDFYYAEQIARPEPTPDDVLEQTKKKRQAAYSSEADPLRLEWDEQRARLENIIADGGFDAESVERQTAVVEKLRSEWLITKDNIRKRFPYA
jgi:hypothetical protein